MTFASIISSPPLLLLLSHSPLPAPSRESQRSSVSPHRLGYSLELVNLGNRTWTATDFSYSSAYNRSRESAPRKMKHPTPCYLYPLLLPHRS